MFKIENLLSNEEIKNSQKNSDNSSIKPNNNPNQTINGSAFNASLIQQQLLQHLQSLQQANSNFFHQFNLHNANQQLQQQQNHHHFSQ